MDRDEAAARVIDGRAWAEFCDLLKGAGDVVLRDGSPDDPLDRAEGFRMLTRLLRAGLENMVEHSDPAHPELICTCHETMKIVGDNPDNIYLGASIDGRYDYRVWGTRGDAPWISFNLFEQGSFGSGGTGTARALYSEDLEVGPDGSFELWLTREPREGNWLPTTPATRTLVIRQSIGDPKAEEPADLRIECLGIDEPPPPLDPAWLYGRLLGAAYYVQGVSTMAADWAEGQARRLNEFVDVDAWPDEARTHRDPQIGYHQAYFDLADDEALVVEVTPPDCPYWMFVVHNHWMESLDYRHHRIALNHTNVHQEDDGSVRVVLAHDDPGLPNWLTTAGHRRGTIGMRYQGPDLPDVMPVARVVKVGDLRAPS